MALSVYNGRLFKDADPWVQVILSDLATSLVYELTITDDRVHLEPSALQLTNYLMYDSATSLSWEVFVENGVVGIVVASSDGVYVGDGYSNMAVKVGQQFFVNVLNKDSTGEDDKITFTLISEDTWVQYYADFTDIQETSQGNYRSDVRVMKAGNYVLVISIAGYGNITQNIEVIGKTIVDMNQRLENLNKDLLTVYSKAWI